MANRDLIAGTQQVYGNRFVDAAKALKAGMDEPIAQANKIASNRLASMKETDAKVKSYMDELNTEMDLLQFDKAEQASINKFLFNQKQKYAKLANELVRTNATDGKYIEIKNEMDGIKQSFLNLKAQADKFIERRLKYLDDYDRGNLSKGNKAEVYNMAGRVYGGGTMVIDETGEINIDVGNGELVRYSDVKDPILKDREVAGQIADKANALYKAGVKLSTTNEDSLGTEIKNLLSRDGGLESVVDDGIVNGKRLNVDLDAYENRGDAINDVTEMILQGYRDVAAAGAEEKRIREGQNKRNASAAGGKVSDTGSSDRGSFYMGYSKNTADHKKLANSAWEKSETALQNVLDAIEKDKNEEAYSILKDHEDGINFKFYASEDAYKQKSRQSSYYLKPMIDLNSREGYIAYKRGSDGEWTRISKEDFDKEISGTAGVGPKTSSKPNMG